jgi:transcriptional regulator with XRE-family HTH domain
MNDRRRSEGLTWFELARRLRCSPNQLLGLRSARFAISMTLAMRITQWLERPAADFIYAARW